MIDPILTPEQLAEVQAYYAPHYAIGKVLPLFDTIISVLMLVYVVRPVWGVASRGAAGLEARFGRLRSLPGSRVLFKVLDKLWGGSGWGAALLFAFIWFGIDVAISLPLDVYLEYFHEHAFGKFHHRRQLVRPEPGQPDRVQRQQLLEPGRAVQRPLMPGRHR